MATINVYVKAHDKLSAAIERRFFRNWLSAIALLASVLPVKAIPPPPPKAPLLREAKMAVTVHLIEAKDGRVTRRTKLCKVSGKIPVYSDNGSPASFNAWEITGCTMPKNGENLTVSVWGAKAISKGRVAFATAGVSVVPPDAVPLCVELCGPQPLADSRAEIRVSGTPKLMNFSLNANPVSMLNAKPTVWLDADVEIVD
ncbi:MAG: hypothetical protein JWQ80_3426 [Massilia sp.]|nr:hypothetical protein [Massilia sp.]